MPELEMPPKREVALDLAPAFEHHLQHQPVVDVELALTHISNKHDDISAAEQLRTALLHDPSPRNLLKVALNPAILPLLRAADASPHPSSPHQSGALRAAFAAAASLATWADDGTSAYVPPGGPRHHPSVAPVGLTAVADELSPARSRSEARARVGARVAQRDALFAAASARATSVSDNDVANHGPAAAGAGFIAIAAAHLALGGAADACAGDRAAAAELGAVGARYAAAVATHAIAYGPAYDYVRYLAASGAPRGTFAECVRAFADRIEADLADAAKAGGDAALDHIFKEIGRYVVLPLLQTATSGGLHCRVLLTIASRFVLRFTPTFAPTELAHAALWVSQQAALASDCPHVSRVAYSVDSIANADAIAAARGDAFAASGIPLASSAPAVGLAEVAVRGCLNTLAWMDDATVCGLPLSTLSALWHAACWAQSWFRATADFRDSHRMRSLRTLMQNAFAQHEFADNPPPPPQSAAAAAERQRRAVAATAPSYAKQKTRVAGWDPRADVFTPPPSGLPFRQGAVSAAASAVQSSSTAVPGADDSIERVTGKELRICDSSRVGPFTTAAIAFEGSVGAPNRRGSDTLSKFAVHIVDDLEPSDAPYPLHARVVRPLPFPPHASATRGGPAATGRSAPPTHTLPHPLGIAPSASPPHLPAADAPDSQSRVPAPGPSHLESLGDGLGRGPDRDLAPLDIPGLPPAPRDTSFGTLATLCVRAADAAGGLSHGDCGGDNAVSPGSGSLGGGGGPHVGATYGSDVATVDVHVDAAGTRRYPPIYGSALPDTAVASLATPRWVPVHTIPLDVTRIAPTSRDTTVVVLYRSELDGLPKAHMDAYVAAQVASAVDSIADANEPLRLLVRPALPEAGFEPARQGGWKDGKGAGFDAAV